MLTKNIKKMMRLKQLLSVLAIYSLCTINTVELSAQSGVGIGTNTPDNSAALDIVSPSGNKGILIPRLNNAEINNLTSIAATGLLVFNTTDNRFYYYNGTEWRALNEMVRTKGSTVVSHTGNLTVTGTVSGTNYGLNTTGNGPVPKGGIIMWSGTTPPAGWALCNGGNGTPNLQGRFIVGYQATGDTDYDQPGNKSTGGGTNGKTGGAKSVTLTTAQMPSHNHDINGQNRNDFGGGGFVAAVGGAGPEDAGDTGNRGGGQAHENRPPYYTLAFIMKL